MEGSTFTTNAFIIFKKKKDSAKDATPFISSVIMQYKGYKLLDSKYSTLFVKNKNIPIIKASHIPPGYKSDLRQKAFDSRVKYCTFVEGDYLDDNRFAKTLLQTLKNRKSKELEINPLRLKKIQKIHSAIISFSYFFFIT